MKRYTIKPKSEADILLLFVMVIVICACLVFSFKAYHQAKQQKEVIAKIKTDFTTAKDGITKQNQQLKKLLKPKEE